VLLESLEAETQKLFMPRAGSPVLETVRNRLGSLKLPMVKTVSQKAAQCWDSFLSFWMNLSQINVG